MVFKMLISDVWFSPWGLASLLSLPFKDFLVPYRVRGSLKFGDLGHNLGSLGRSWRQVGNILAACWDEDGQRWPKMANLSRKTERSEVGTVAAIGI